MKKNGKVITMLSMDMLYTDKANFKRNLESKKIDLLDHCLVRIYTAICTPEEAAAIAGEIKEVMPNAGIIGGSGSGVIFEGRQYDMDTLVIVEKFDKGKISVHTHTFQDKSSKEMADEIVDTMEENIPLMHLLCGNHYSDIHNFVEEFNNLNHTTKLVGGVAGDILPKNISAYVFTENGVIENGIVTAALCGDTFYTYNEVNIAHTPISACYTIDKSEDGYLLEIEKMSGLQWCKEQFGTDNMAEYSDWQLIAENDALIRFPLVLEGHGGASRFIKYDTAAQEISLYFSQMNEDTKFRIGYTNPTACVRECFDICNNIMSTPVESLFCYTCLFRKLYLGNCAEWELRPFLQYGICGVFMMGELAYIEGRNEFLNGSCSFVGVADREKYINPDFNVFEDLYNIKDDNQKLLSFVLQKQSTTMSLENKELLQKLVEQQEKAKHLLYFDRGTGIKNSIKYSSDNQTYQFDKMCMVQIENAELLTAKLGQEGYLELIGKIAAEIRTFTQNTKYADRIFYYMLNESIFFMAANRDMSEAQFLNITDIFYNKYRVITVNDGSEMLVNRFVVIMNKEDLLTSGLLTLQNCKNLQTHFIFSDDCIAKSFGLNTEMEMLQILNYVIEQQKVIPYFQGIYDNKAKKISEYEALMRIQDAEGNIYAPNAFMDIAKKYHMYSSLSKIMIEKVFILFSNRTERVAINLSAYDINFDEMQCYIIEKLNAMDKVDNFIFEILEDEDFQDMDRLRDFIQKARQFGIKIAIDDFGSGYSNFMEIAKIEPDIIKVDISIIREIESNTNHQKILETIVFLGRQLDAELVAEGVENEKIQEKVEEMGISLSQGFYFARPLPYQELGI